ncbi:hypothetical protein pb186bvf_019847 [Paramecium bursaria]
MVVQVKDRLNLDDVFQFDRVLQVGMKQQDISMTSLSNNIKINLEKNAIQFIKEHNFIQQQSSFTELGFNFQKTCSLIELRPPLDNIDANKLRLITLIKKQKLQELVYQEKLQKSKEIQQAEAQEHPNNITIDHHKNKYSYTFVSLIIQKNQI